MKKKIVMKSLIILAMVFLCLPATSVWAQDPCSFPLETNGDIALQGYDPAGTPVQIVNASGEVVWEGDVGTEEQVIAGFAPGTYALTGPPDGRKFGALDPSQLPQNPHHPDM